MASVSPSIIVSCLVLSSQLLFISSFVTAFTSSASPFPFPSTNYPNPSPASAPPSFDPIAAASQLSALLVFKASIDPTGKALFSWNITSSFYCNWLGVTCHPYNLEEVSEIRLPHLGLEGRTLSPGFRKLTELVVLDMSGNQLSGHLPSFLADVQQMNSLQTLNLSSNRLSGPLPPFLEMYNLQSLDLSSNQLSGPLSDSLFYNWRVDLGSLDLSGNRFSGPLPVSFDPWLSTSLTHLDLSNNQLSGPLPSVFAQMRTLSYLDLSDNQLSESLSASLAGASQLEYLNLSDNRLQGRIPLQVLQKFSWTSFLGNPDLRAPLDENDQYHLNHNRTKRSLAIILGLVGLASSLVCLAVCGLWCPIRNKVDPRLDFVAPHYKAWTSEEVRVATDNFNTSNIIGSGAASVCYRAAMKSPQGMMKVVALKKLRGEFACDEDEARKSFSNECKTLCKLRHRNLVKVLGYCVDQRQGNFALVMEYMEGGDLDKRLHMQHDVAISSTMGKLNWEEKMNVALNVAEGLVYLHHEYERPIIHCDIKPKNILLGADMVAKISDFGIARLLEGKEGGDVSLSKFRGSFGYIAPEYGLGLRISTKVDVYSYGVLLLELVTGVRPTTLVLQNNATNLRTWCETLQASNQIVDVLHNYDLASLEEAKKLLRLGVACTHDIAKERPTMYLVRDCILHLINIRTQGTSLV